MNKSDTKQISIGTQFLCLIHQALICNMNSFLYFSCQSAQETDKKKTCF